MKMVITFRSGAQIRVDVSEFSTGESPVTGKLIGIRWTTPEEWGAKLYDVDLEQVAAIHAEREPGDG